MGGYLQPLPRLCPKSEHLYTVKLQEFETYARRDIRVEAVVIAPKLDALIGGLVGSNSCLALRSLQYYLSPSIDLAIIGGQIAADQVCVAYQMGANSALQRRARRVLYPF